MNTNLLKWLLPIVLLVFPLSAGACEPIMPLAQLFGGPHWFARSLWWLGIAVAVKCVIFVFLEHQLRWHEAVLFMLLANVISSIPGALTALAAATPPILLVALPITYALSITPARRLVAYATWTHPKPWLKPSWVAAICPVGIFISWFMFGAAAAVLDNKQYLLYWIFKLAYIITGLIIGLTLTSLWEEAIVARLALRRHGASSYLQTVVCANYITIGILLLGAAIPMIPKRLHSTGFLAQIAGLLVK